MWNVREPSSPDTVLEVSGQLVALAFHPKQPSKLAGGTYNGEILLWDFSVKGGADPQVMASAISDYHHREAIFSMQWIEQGDHTLLATVLACFNFLLAEVSQV